MNTFKASSLKLIPSGVSGRQANTDDISDTVKDFPEILTQTDISEEKLARNVQLLVHELLFSDEFREFLEKVIDNKVREIADEIIDELDLDEGHPVKQQFEASLKARQQEGDNYVGAEDVWRELGLDE